MFNSISKLFLFVLAALLLAGFSLSIDDAYAQSLNANPRAFLKGQPQNASELPSGKFKDRLQSLPPKERGKAMKTLQAFAFSELDLEYMRIDNEGGVFYVDTFDVGEPSSAETDLPVPDAIAEEDTFLLHSRPGAPNVVYLDFDGHVISGTAWNDGDVDPFYATAFDTSGDDTELTACVRGTTAPEWDVNFTSTELAKIQEIWHRTAEDFAPWNIDVTTQEPDTFDRYTGRVLYTGSHDYCGDEMPSGTTAGGIAYVVVFGNSNYHTYTSPALVYWENLGNGSATSNHEAGSHEFGHNLGLGHDGTSSSTYYTGHGSSDTSPVDLNSWAPIMGVGYYRNVTQWSKGDYPGAVMRSSYQTELDDLLIITSELGYRPDDHGDTVGAAATPLVIQGDGTIAVTNPEDDPHYFNTDNKGVIEDRNDVDVFSFITGGGTIEIFVEPAWAAFYRGFTNRGANLDIEATLYDSGGSPIISSDPLDDTDAYISTSVAAGEYYLAIDGVGNPGNTNDSSNENYGYDDYASIGMYFISGTVPATGGETDPPLPNPMTFAVAPTSTGSTSITMTATTATDASGPVQYYFYCSSGGAGCAPSGWQTSTVFDATGLEAGTSYSYQVRARDALNNLTAYSDPASATTDAAPPTAPSNPAAVAQSQTEILVTWTDNSDNEDGFKFLHSSDGVSFSHIYTTSANATGVIHSGLSPNTTHYYMISATNAEGDSAAAGPVNATTWDTEPAAPTGLSANAVSFDQINLAWTDNAGNETAFEVERSPNGTDSWAQVGTVGANVETFSDTGLSELTPYWYRVRATNSNGNVVSAYAGPATATTLEAPPGAPTSLIATPVSSNQVDLQWNDNSDNENGFSIEFSTVGSSGPWSTAGSAAVDDTDFSHSGLSESTQHWYRVKATHLDGGVGDSPWSNVDSTTTFAGCSGTKSIAAGYWEMFSLPCNPGPANTVEQLFSDLDVGTYGSDWVVYDLDENTDQFVLKATNDALQVGIGYWVWSSQPATVNINGFPWAQPTADIPLVSDATDGFFNFVGHNRNENVDWAEVIVDDGKPNPPTVLEADPYGSGQNSNTLECDMVPVSTNKCLMSRVMYKWSGSNFDPYDGETEGMEGILEPFDSFWVKAFAPGIELRIPDVPPLGSIADVSDVERPGNSGSKASGKDKKAGPEAWSIRLTARSGNKQDKGNMMGRLPDSLDGLDRRDLEELAPFGNRYLSLVFTNPLFDEVSWGYTSDYRALTNAPAGEWPFKVRAGLDLEEITLSWSSKYSVLENAWLLDETTGELVKLDNGSSYTFRNETGEHHFVVIIE